MEQWNKLVGLVKEFYIAFGQGKYFCYEKMNLLEEKNGDVEAVVKHIFFEGDMIFEKIWAKIDKNKFGKIFCDAFEEVHRSNMSKLENGKAIFREDGKILKGKNYFRPNLKQFIK